MKTVPMLVRFSTTQVTSLTGKNILSIALSADGKRLEVVKKKFRGGYYDKQFYTLDKVLAYSAGEGVDSGAYAVVYTDVILKEVSGEGVFLDETNVRISDDKGMVHEINLEPNATNISISITQPRFKEIEADEDEPKRKPKPVSKVKEFVSRVQSKQKERLRSSKRNVKF